jgi:putative ATPase
MATNIPLATKLRPTTLEEFLGQQQLLGENGPLRQMVNSGNIPSMIFWGPPGVGKTTLAKLIANYVSAEFLELSAVTAGKADLKQIIGHAQLNSAQGKSTILFIDEIHRWNKAQQDALLPHVESGIITLIGATTENPSFTVVSPLLSRSRVFVFENHIEQDLLVAIEKGGKKLGIKIAKDAAGLLANLSNGDMRFCLNSLEIAAQLAASRKQKSIDVKVVEDAVQKFLRYDKTGEEHYNIISAVHKSLRSSNASAATYWILRMLAAGEDPLYIARRLVRFASEDIGNASPNALLLANIVYETCQKIGMPECEVALIQLAEYLAKAPKDNSAYMATNLAKQDIQRYGNLPVPMHIRNAPTKLMKNLGYGNGYQYDHDLPNKKSDQQLFPDELVDRDYFKK